MLPAVVAVEDALPLGVVPVEDEPWHPEVWRSSRLRLLHAAFPACGTCLWHAHRRFTVYICLTPVDVLEEQWGSPQPTPLRLPKGSVFCRDHAAQPLVHRATTGDDSVLIVGIELMARGDVDTDATRTEQHAGPFDNAATTNATISCIHDDRSKCRVYRVELEASSQLAFALSSVEAVLVAIDTCDIRVENDESTATRRMKCNPGDDIRLATPSHSSISLTPSTRTAVATFILVEVFGRMSTSS